MILPEPDINEKIIQNLSAIIYSVVCDQSLNSLDKLLKNENLKLLFEIIEKNNAEKSFVLHYLKKYYDNRTMTLKPIMNLQPLTKIIKQRQWSVQLSFEELNKITNLDVLQLNFSHSLYHIHMINFMAENNLFSEKDCEDLIYRNNNKNKIPFLACYFVPKVFEKFLSNEKNKKFFIGLFENLSNNANYFQSLNQYEEIKNLLNNAKILNNMIGQPIFENILKQDFLYILEKFNKENRFFASAVSVNYKDLKKYTDLFEDDNINKEMDKYFNLYIKKEILTNIKKETLTEYLKNENTCSLEKKLQMFQEVMKEYEFLPSIEEKINIQYEKAMLQFKIEGEKKDKNVFKL